MSCVDDPSGRLTALGGDYCCTGCRFPLSEGNGCDQTVNGESVSQICLLSCGTCSTSTPGSTTTTGPTTGSCVDNATWVHSVGGWGCVDFANHKATCEQGTTGRSCWESTCFQDAEVSTNCRSSCESCNAVTDTPTPSTETPSPGSQLCTSETGQCSTFTCSCQSPNVKIQKTTSSGDLCWNCKAPTTPTPDAVATLQPTQAPNTVAPVITDTQSSSDPAWYKAAIAIFIVGSVCCLCALIAYWWQFRKEKRWKRKKLLGVHDKPKKQKKGIKPPPKKALPIVNPLDDNYQNFGTSAVAPNYQNDTPSSEQHAKLQELKERKLALLAASSPKPVQVAPNVKPPSSKKKKLKPGTKVEANWEGTWCPATILGYVVF